MSHGVPGDSAARLVAVLGPTNTGKTHLAVERMLGHASGMIGLPLRLLAREIYDRIVRARGARAVALITGEEKIVPPRAHYFVCTVEAMPLARKVAFLAVDEIQLAADPERGHLFTHRLLHARGEHETMFLGAGTMAPLIRRLLPEAQIVTRERFSALSYSGVRKISRLARRSAVVAFSADQVYAIAELIRRQRGGAAVVMGSLSPRTRNAQVALYQSGEVDFLVATDAIGMGLNMDVDHVAFAGLEKFDGRRRRPLHPQEIGQIAGRAGRFRTDGTFGVTGGCEPMDDDLAAAVENHQFEAVAWAQWRNSDLDFAGLPALMRSLAEPPRRTGLKAAEEALDERALRTLAKDAAIFARCADRASLHRLWDACQTPDFCKTTPDEHIRLVRQLFDYLTLGAARVPDDWMAQQHRGLDRLDGEIDALSARLAGVRTLAYVAHRPDWLADAEHWRGVTRVLEDRLSDTLHEKLMARFIDRRTSALIRGLGSPGDLLAGVSAQGEVTVEGHVVGRLRGLRFEPASSRGPLEAKAIRAAAIRAAGPEISRRLGRLAAEPDDAFTLEESGDILWRGEAAATLAGDQPFNPRVRLYQDLGAEPARIRAIRRLEAFAAAEASRRLGSLKRLGEAVQSGALKGLARGLAYRLIEAGGAIDRRALDSDIRNLSQAERRALKGLGVRIGTFCVFLPAQAAPAARSVTRAFARQAARGWAPVGAGPWPAPQPPAPVRALGLLGALALGRWLVDVWALEALAEQMRAAKAAEPANPGFAPGAAGLLALGWSEAQAADILSGLGFRPTRATGAGGPTLWRRARAKPPASAPVRQGVASPFAALAVLTQTAAIPPRRRRRRRAPGNRRAG